MNIEIKFNIGDEIIYLSEDPNIKGKIIPLKGIIKNISFDLNYNKHSSILYSIETEFENLIINEIYIDNNINNLLKRIPINCNCNITYNLSNKCNIINEEQESEPDDELPF